MALLILAWRESQRNEGGPPAWLPMPAVIGCLTLTLIFWIGLQERELTFLGEKTATATDQIATTIKTNIDQQVNALDRLARNGTDNPDNNMAAWESDAAQLFDESKELGCTSISFIDAGLKTRWAYPVQENVGSLGYDHASDPLRKEAIEAAHDKNAPVVCATADVEGKKGSGFVIYAPIGRNGGPHR